MRFLVTIISLFLFITTSLGPASAGEDTRTVKRKKPAQASAPAKNSNIGDYYALIIAINDYEDKGINDLKTAVNDGKELAAVLGKDFGFKVTTLLDRQASWENIDKELHRLAKVTKEKDSVLIYYAGHGNLSTENKKEEGWWYPADSVSGQRKSYFNNDKIRTAMDSIPARHVLLVSDSCFAGSLFGSYRSIAPDKSQLDKYYGRLYNRKSRWGLTSGGKEPVMDGGSDGHSVFAYHFLHHLKNADRPVFSVRDLHLLIARTVTNNSSQKPECLPIRNTGHMGGEFVFIRRGTDLASFKPEDIPALAPPPMNKKLFVLFGGLVVCLAAGAAFFYLVKPKQIARKEENSLREAVGNRDRQQIGKILDSSKVQNEELKKLADDLTGKVAGLRLEGLDSPVYVAPGPRQGLGRGDDWVFKFSDPHVSRRPHAWLLAEGDHLLLQKETGSVAEILINDSVVESGQLQEGDCFGLGSLTEVEVEKLIPGQGAFMKVIKGPEAGTHLVLLTGSAALGNDLAGVHVRCGSIFWQNDRPRLRVTSDENRPLASMPVDAEKVLLADHDILKVGAKDLIVHLVVEK